MTDSMIIDLFFARDELALSECDKKYGQSLRRFGAKHKVFGNEALSHKILLV